MAWLIKAFDYGLEQCIKIEQQKAERNQGAYIPTSKYHRAVEKDFTVLPKFVDEEAVMIKEIQSSVNLKYLTIGYNDIDDFEIFEDFKVGLNKSNIIELDMSYNNLGDAAIKALGQSFHGQCQISKLNFTSTKLSYRGAHAIFAIAQRFHGLKELTLDKNSLDGSKLRILRELLYNNKGLRILNLNDCHLGEDGAFFLA